MGTFQIINGQKVGGNVASYFCTGDSTVVHAIPGKVNADQLLSESRWAYETRKAASPSAPTSAPASRTRGSISSRSGKQHTKRYNAEMNPWGNLQASLPMRLPTSGSQQAQAHWLLARNPTAELENLYPVVWTKILQEKLSGRRWTSIERVGRRSYHAPRL